MLKKIINLFLSLCILALASCSLSKNVSKKGSNEKLRLLQQDERQTHKEVIVTQSKSLNLHIETPEPKVASRVISPVHKPKALVANKLSFHKEKNTGMNKSLFPALSNER